MWQKRSGIGPLDEGKRCESHRRASGFAKARAVPYFSSFMSFNTRVFIALGAGIGAGALLTDLDPTLAERVSSIVGPVGSLWVNALLMLVMPLVLASLVVGVAGAADLSAIGRLGRRSVAAFLVLVCISAVIAITVVPPITAQLHVDPAAAASLRASVTSPAPGASEVQTAGQWIASLLPSNPVKAAADGKLLPLVIYAVLFSLALTQLPRERAVPVVDFCAGIVDALRVLVRWILALAPIGVFALSVPLAVRFGLVAAGLLGFYLLLTSGLCTVIGLLAYPVARLAGGVPLRVFARAAAPAQTVGFVARSSIASLPAMMDGARELGLPESVISFVLPLAVAAFKATAPMAFFAGSLFLARLYGVTVVPSQLPFVAVQSVLLSFAVPGILGGSIVTMAPILLTLGVPLEGLGLLLAVDIIADMFRSSSNAGMDLAVATVVARLDRAHA
jgi:Na+/H+-dicarboxylate symporter